MNIVHIYESNFAMTQLLAAAASTPFYEVASYQTEDSLAFLIGRCINRITDTVDAALAELGINSQQFGVLHAILRGRVETPSGLARLRFQNSAAITYTLDGLEAKQLLVRVRSERDRRQVRLVLTDEGRALTQRGLSLVVDAQNRILENLNRDQYRTLDTLLRRVAGEYATQGEAGASPT